MRIYTLYYTDTGLHNKSIFICPNNQTAIKAMKLNLMDKTSPSAQRFRDECSTGTVQLCAIAEWSDEKGIENCLGDYFVCNLKDLLDDNTGDLVEPKQDNT